MTTLGEILDQLHDRSEIDRILAGCGDAGLLSHVEQIAGAAKEDTCEAVLRIVRTFAGKADDEAWVKLIGSVQNAPSPAGACLAGMIAWSMKRQPS